jgi:hypothetical protein
VHDREIIELVDALVIDDDEVEHDEFDEETIVDEDDDAEKDIVYLELKHYIDEGDDEVVIVVVQNDEDADEGLVIIDTQLLHIEVDEVEVDLLVIIVAVVHDEMDVNEYLWLDTHQAVIITLLDELSIYVTDTVSIALHLIEHLR